MLLAFLFQQLLSFIYDASCSVFCCANNFSVLLSFIVNSNLASNRTAISSATTTATIATIIVLATGAPPI